MNRVLAALGASLESLRRPRMLLLLLVPPALGAVLWFTAGIWAWHQLYAWLQGQFNAPWLEHVIGASAAGWLTGALVAALAAPLFLSLVLATALLITSLVALPVILIDLSEHDFPRLEQKQGGSWLGSLLQALLAVLGYLLVWLLTLPLMAIVPFGPVIIPLLLHGLFNVWLFRYDVLTQHASKAEYRELVRLWNGEFYLLGTALAVLQWVPVLNIVTPVFTAVAFAQFGLARLSELRQSGALATAAR